MGASTSHLRYFIRFLLRLRYFTYRIRKIYLPINNIITARSFNRKLALKDVI